MSWSDERWLRADRLLDLALDLAPEDRERFLRGVCADDTAMRHAVLRLVDLAEDCTPLPHRVD
jgi:hypothetical protein